MKCLLVFVCLVLAMFTTPVFTGCSSFKGAEIAEGQDPVVVNAERAQKSSLDIFRLVTKWEYDNRAALPPEVSRAVDEFRKEFPPAWRESRMALQAYQDQAGPDASDIERITAALLVAQDSLLKLRKEGSTNEAVQAANALSSLVYSIRAVFHRNPVTE